jgi:hypothetical protein
LVARSLGDVPRFEALAERLVDGLERKPRRVAKKKPRARSRGRR